MTNDDSLPPDKANSSRTIIRMSYEHFLELCTPLEKGETFEELRARVKVKADADIREAVLAHFQTLSLREKMAIGYWFRFNPVVNGPTDAAPKED